MKLKNYKQTKTDRGVGLTCPRRGCGGKFIVNLDGIWEQREKEAEKRTIFTDPVKTIPCPYCMKVSLIPGESSDDDS